MLFGSLVIACGSARVVSRTQYGGVVALQGDRGKAMEQAHKEMAAHCGPGNYSIVQEGEEVIGTDTVAQSDTAYGEDTEYGEHSHGNSTHGGSSTAGGSSTTAQSSTRNAVEWRVHYQCGGAPAGAGPAPAPPGPPPSGGGAPPPPGY